MKRTWGRAHKYGAVRTEYNGRSYASKAEARRASELDLDLAAGVLASVTPQPVVTLGCPENKYRPDFAVVDEHGALRYEDVKGMSTQAFRRWVRLWKVYGPAPLWVLRARGRRWNVEIIPGGAEG